MQIRVIDIAFITFMGPQRPLACERFRGFSVLWLLTLGLNCLFRPARTCLVPEATQLISQTVIPGPSINERRRSDNLQSRMWKVVLRCAFRLTSTVRGDVIQSRLHWQWRMLSNMRMRHLQSETSPPSLDHSKLKRTSLMLRSGGMIPRNT